MAIGILLGNSVLLGNFKIQTIIWPWKTVKQENDDVNFAALFQESKTVFKYEISP